MPFEEYKKRMIEIRQKVNSLCDDLGATYSTMPEIMEKVLNISMCGNFEDVKNGKVRTYQYIHVDNFREYGDRLGFYL